MGRGARWHSFLWAAATASAAAAGAGTAAAIPDDWAKGVARHDLLFSPSDPTTMLQPVLSNGLVGWTVGAPHVFLAGVYNGEGQLSHRARIPATLAVAVKGPAGAEESYLGTCVVRWMDPPQSQHAGGAAATWWYIIHSNTRTITPFPRRGAERARGQLRAAASVQFLARCRRRPRRGLPNGRAALARP